MKVTSALAKRVRHIKSLLRFAPFDVSTEGGRANERHRRATLTALAAAAAKGLSIGTALITVPLTLNYLGTERYGMWMTISSLVAMLSFADLGIGNGILNAVSAAHGRNDTPAIKEYVSSGFLVLTLVAILIVVIFACTYRVVPWHEIFNVRSVQSRQESGPALAVLIVCFAWAIPLGVVQRVQTGLQNGFVANLWQCFGSVMGLAAVVLAVWLNAGLPWLVFALAGSPLVASLLNSVIYFVWLHPEAAPSPKWVSWRAMKTIAHIGILFFVLQIVATFAYTSDNIVIAQILGPDAVAEYSVPQRLFSVISMLLIMLLSPLWPAYGEAIARGDNVWARSAFRRSFLVSVGAATIASFVLIVFGSQIIGLWVGHIVAPSLLLLIGLGLWQVVQAGGNAAAMILNGSNVMSFQIYVAVITGVVIIALKILLVERIGIAGAVWSSVIGFVVCAALPVYRKVLAITEPQRETAA